MTGVKCGHDKARSERALLVVGLVIAVAFRLLVFLSYRTRSGVGESEVSSDVP